MYKNQCFKTRNKGLEYTDFVQPPLNMVIDLKGKDWLRLMSGFSPKIRCNIRPAEKSSDKIYKKQGVKNNFSPLLPAYRDKKFDLPLTKALAGGKII